MPLANSIHDQPREQRHPHGLPRGTARDVMLNRGEAGNRTKFLERDLLVRRESRICRSGDQSIVSGQANVDGATGWRRPPISPPNPSTGHPTPPRLDPPLTQSHGEAGELVGSQCRPGPSVQIFMRGMWVV